LTADEVYEVAAQANPKLARLLGLLVEEVFE
jgi:hypothetical protein